MRLEIICQDRLGIAQDVLDILVRHEIDLKGIEIDKTGKIYLHFPSIEFAEFQHLMPEIRRIDGISDVKTIPYMPNEREKHQLATLLQTLPDPVFSIDPKGRVVLVNEAVVAGLECSIDEIKGSDINELVKGFNVNRWMDSDNIQVETHKVQFIEQDFIADIMPVMVSDVEGGNILAGAVLLLKSEYRLGQQVNAFNQTDGESFERIQANSPLMKKVVKEARKMAELDAPMLISGETGTGKELLAYSCHLASRRAEQEFLALNCASLPDNVAETELFGYGPGAFGQSESKSGLFEQAQGGTLFLDEVGDMSPQLQAKLLRVLHDGSFRRVGDAKEVKVDVRIICTTHKDLQRLVDDGLFREDLYYRLNVMSVHLPPLRERKQDIVPLAERFVKQHSSKVGCRPPKLNRSCVEYLQSYPWPGNVRQLENAMYRAVSLMEGTELSKDSIQLPGANSEISYFAEDFEGTLDEAVKNFEKELLRRLYPAHPSTRQLAKKLGLSHTAIANKLRDYGINKKSVKF
ncbi:transcriptional regulator TyrR [Neptunicella marina]|uniref:HTH-type transcriptional regulatory protein TyrR n=1 Tax=Neptunicella marina TaxID=2125989 RepID=A0A8J6IVM0_9ALTE|nr:transcriptional regulator TyrR [Neptunicella marina]MBC3766428.1 transcriptional regulator TyrR [Neptunicella marina]